MVHAPTGAICLGELVEAGLRPDLGLEICAELAQVVPEAREPAPFCVAEGRYEAASQLRDALQVLLDALDARAIGRNVGDCVGRRFGVQH
jgi:hypothetical protein